MRTHACVAFANLSRMGHSSLRLHATLHERVMMPRRRSANVWSGASSRFSVGRSGRATREPHDSRSDLSAAPRMPIANQTRTRT
jgi:hypothetical protein